MERARAARLVWAVAAGLEPRQYSVLDLSVRQEMDAAEIGAALGVSRNNAYVLVNRLKRAFSEAAYALADFTAGRAACPELRSALSQTGLEQFSPQARRVVERHAHACVGCQARRQTMPSPLETLAGLATAAAPIGLRERGWEAIRSAAPGAGPARPGRFHRPTVRRAGMVGGAAVAAGVVAAALFVALSSGHSSGLPLAPPTPTRTRARRTMTATPSAPLLPAPTAVRVRRSPTPSPTRRGTHVLASLTHPDETGGATPGVLAGPATDAHPHAAASIHAVAGVHAAAVRNEDAGADDDAAADADLHADSLPHLPPLARRWRAFSPKGASRVRDPALACLRDATHTGRAERGQTMNTNGTSSSGRTNDTMRRSRFPRSHLLPLTGLAVAGLVAALLGTSTIRIGAGAAHASRPPATQAVQGTREALGMAQPGGSAQGQVRPAVTASGDPHESAQPAALASGDPHENARPAAMASGDPHESGAAGGRQAMPPAPATGTIPGHGPLPPMPPYFFRGVWRGIPMRLSRVTNVSVEQLPGAVLQADHLSGFFTTDPYYSCLDGKVLNVWTAPQFPDEYVVHNGDQGPQCVYITLVMPRRYRGEFRGIQVSLARVANVSVEQLPGAVLQADHLSGFVTTDPYYSCLGGKLLNVWTAPQFPDEYVVHNGDQGPQCVYGTFLIPRLFFGVWQGKRVPLARVPNVSVEDLPGAVLQSGQVLGFVTTDPYYTCLDGKPINVWTAPRFAGVLVAHNGDQGPQCVYSTWTFR